MKTAVEFLIEKLKLNKDHEIIQQALKIEQEQKDREWHIGFANCERSYLDKENDVYEDLDKWGI